MAEEKQWVRAVVLDVLPKGLYRVRCFDGRELTAAMSRECKRVGVKIIPGQGVEVSVSRLDPKRGQLKCF